ncbi:hypothetical protein [Streptosporangium sp. NBC_01469]|uniref:hypothetical protein n=1 Tax=Streptosporangium sp. NBC_01469 TaxID=2903898 RepID=UPI002E2CFF13|nr:hypothetical protein [Streptosporangium sp. NBC_01469]
MGMVDEATAERHDRALAVVQRLLIERGIRAHRHHPISLGVFAAQPGAPTQPGAPARTGGPAFRSRADRHPPELAVIAQGRRAATVTIGPRSGCYLVSVRRGGPNLHAVGREQPHRVVELIVTDRLDERP